GYTSRQEGGQVAHSDDAGRLGGRALVSALSSGQCQILPSSKSRDPPARGAPGDIRCSLSLRSGVCLCRHRPCKQASERGRPACPHTRFFISDTLVSPMATQGAVRAGEPPVSCKGEVSSRDPIRSQKRAALHHPNPPRNHVKSARNWRAIRTSYAPRTVSSMPVG